LWRAGAKRLIYANWIMKKNTPPHLPPPLCHVSNYRLKQRLKLLFFICFISMLAGLSGASIMINWIWPYGTDVGLMSYSFSRQQSARVQLQDKVKTEISSRVVKVYNLSAVLPDKSLAVLPAKDRLADAVIFSSDGWAVFYAPVKPIVKQLYAVNSADAVVEIEKTVYDLNSRLMYVKLKDENLKVVNFSDDYSLNQAIFIYENNVWTDALLAETYYDFHSSPHLDSAPINSVLITGGKFSIGRVVINEQGRFIGFTIASDRLILANNILNVMSGFLNNQAIIYPSLGVEGQSAREQSLVFAGKAIPGFYVSKVWASPSPFRVGDVILQINGIIADRQEIWYIINNINQVSVKVLRAGQEIEFNVNVLKMTVK